MAGIMRRELPKPGELLDLYGGRKLGRMRRLGNAADGVDIFNFKSEKAEACVASFDTGFYFKSEVNDRLVKVSFFESLFTEFDRKSGRLTYCKLDLLRGLLNAEAMGVPFSNEIHEGVMNMLQQKQSLAMVIVPNKKATNLFLKQIDHAGESRLLEVHRLVEKDFGTDEIMGVPVDYLALNDEGLPEPIEEIKLAAWRGKLPFFPGVEIALGIYETFLSFIITSDVDDLTIAYPVNMQINVSGLDARQLDFELAREFVRQAFRGILF